MPSIVSTSRSSASRPSIRQDKIERPSTRMVHVPHSPNSQPCFVPVNPRSSRRTSSKVLCGAKATSAASPLSVNAMWAFCLSASVIVQGKEPLYFFVTNDTTLFRSLDAFFDLPANIQTVHEVLPGRFGGQARNCIYCLFFGGLHSVSYSSLK